METKYHSLELTKKELDAIEIYTGYKHFEINYMLNTDISKATEDNRGWHIDNSIENIEKNIKIIENLYSAMYKYMKNNGDIKFHLFLGVSKNELNNLKKLSEYGNILSTTIDKDVAVSFSEYEIGGILEIKTNNNIPYIVPNRVLNDSKNLKNENEYIISPFCIIDKFEKNTLVPSNIYNISISKQDLPILSNNEKKANLQFIDSNIDKLTSLPLEYSKLYDEIDNLNSMISSKNQLRKEDLEDIWNRKLEIFNILSNISEEYKNIKDQLVAYTKSCCSEKEHEIERNIISDKEEITKQHIKDNQDIIIDLKRLETNKYDKLIYESKQLNKNFDKTTDISKQIADEFGMNFIPNISKEDYGKYIEDLNCKLLSVKEQLDNILVSEDDSINSTNSKILKLKELNLKLETIKTSLNQVKELSTVYRNDSLEIIKTEILNLANTAIMTDEMKKLNEHEHSIVNTKSNIMDKITGKSRLNKVKLEQIQLKRDILKYSSKYCTSNDIKDILSYIDEYVKTKCFGETPKNINHLRSTIVTCFDIKGVNTLENNHSKANNTQIISTDDISNLGFIRNKTQYNIISSQNIELNEILDEYRNNHSSNLHKDLSYNTTPNIKVTFENIIVKLDKNFNSSQPEQAKYDS